MSAPMVAMTGDATDWLAAAVREGGGQVGPLDRADAVVHRGSADILAALPDRIRWVQLCNAGIEAYLDAGLIDERRVFTSAAGVYAHTVAEHAVGMLLAGVRGLVAAAGRRQWQPEQVAPRITGLAGSTIAVVGAGGIGRRIIELLAPFRVSVLAVTRRGTPVAGADRTFAAEQISAVWQAGVDHVILAAPATPATRHLINAAVLGSLRPHSWVVNIARGSLIDTAALLDALRAGGIAGAALDVTDPEPLPVDHPLWTAPGVLITPHTANPRSLGRAALAQRVRENVARFAAGQELLGVIDTEAGY